MHSATPTIIGLPYDASSSFLRGAAEAPPVIRAALRSLSSNEWSESLIDLGADGVLADAGDLDLSDAATVLESIEHGVRAVIDGGGRPISLGGDHSVTYPVLRAIRRSHPKLTILHIDAHPDLYDEFEGDRHSHACPFARIMENQLADRLVQVGIRTMSGRQREQVERFGVEVIDMRAWSAGVRPAVEGPVYVSLDMDALDPAFAPGVSHHEPGGLSTREVITLIQSIPRGTIIGADVVELNPRRDSEGLTAPVCAKLVKELASHMLER